jgi:hypothetical protein
MERGGESGGDLKAFKQTATALDNRSSNWDPILLILQVL